MSLWSPVRSPGSCPQTGTCSLSPSPELTLTLTLTLTLLGQVNPAMYLTVLEHRWIPGSLLDFLCSSRMADVQGTTDGSVLGRGPMAARFAESPGHRVPVTLLPACRPAQLSVPVTAPACPCTSLAWPMTPSAPINIQIPSSLAISPREGAKQATSKLNSPDSPEALHPHFSGCWSRSLALEHPLYVVHNGVITTLPFLTVINLSHLL